MFTGITMVDLGSRVDAGSKTQKIIQQIVFKTLDQKPCFLPDTEVLCLTIPAHVICTDSQESLRVVIESGSMVADRCVLLPGVRVGRNAILGSGTLAPKGFDALDASVWVGSFRGEPTLFQVNLVRHLYTTKINESKLASPQEYGRPRQQYWLFGFDMMVRVITLSEVCMHKRAPAEQAQHAGMYALQLKVTQLYRLCHVSDLARKICIRTRRVLLCHPIRGSKLHFDCDS